MRLAIDLVALNCTSRLENLMLPKILRLERLLIAQRTASFVCPTCQYRSLSIAQIPRPEWLRTQHGQSRSKRASTVAPISIVNAAKHIPPAAHDLYKSLNTLEKDAPAYTSLSQLQLALRGLESENPVTRIASTNCRLLHLALRY